MDKPLKMLALCDSPTASTGFARVAQNLLPRWLKPHGPFDQIDVWGINYRGERHTLPFWIYDGGNGQDWQSAVNLGRMLMLLSGKALGETGQGPYTHCWMMQDSFCLSNKAKFAEGLRRITDAYKIRSVYYLPVDAPLEPEWMAIVQNVDATVCYTEYGKAEALKALPRTYNPAALRVLPHGCDTAIYRPMEDRMAARRKLFAPAPRQKEFLRDDDFLMVNVNANQRRKDIPRTLRILKELKARGGAAAGKIHYKLALHMSRASSDGVDIGKVAGQLGLVEGVDWLCADKFFSGGLSQLGEDHVAALYNAADLMLTTTLGEGWGFCLTEALGCGCPIAAPLHTACVEIMARASGPTPILPLEAEEYGIVNSLDNSRWRPCVKVAAAVDQIEKFALGMDRTAPRAPLADAAKEWLSWDRIAKEWVPILLGHE